MMAAPKTKGTAMDATRNCINKGEPCPATALFPIIISDIHIAAASGISATQPSAATFGRKMMSTPAKAISDANQVALLVRSFRKRALSKAVIIGVVNPIAVASAKGMRKIDEKKRMVAAATAA